MFILGLVVGPAIGLLAGEQLARVARRGLWRAGVVVVLFLLIVLFLPLFNVELRISLAIGTLLGLLLAATPDTAGQSDEEAQA